MNLLTNKLKSIFLLSIILIFTNSLNAQCPTNYSISVIGMSGVQDSIDNFVLNYPNCNHLQNLVIDQPSWSIQTSLVPLSNIDSIFGDLILVDTKFKDLLGLENLEYVGGDLRIEQQDFNQEILIGLDSLVFVGGNLIYGDNEGPISLDLFHNLTQIGGSLIIENNNGPTIFNGLEKVRGFEQLESIGGQLKIKNHNRLDTINNFQNLTNIGGQLLLEENDVLASNHIFDELVSVGDTLRIINNPDLLIAESFPNLQNISGSLMLTTADTYLSFDQLETVHGIDIRESNNLLTLETFDELNLVSGDLNIVENENLTTVTGFNNLLDIKGTVRIFENDINTLEIFENLENIDSSFLLNENITSISGFENVTNIGKTLNIRSVSVLPDMSALLTVGEDLRFFSLNIETLDHFNTLTQIGGTLGIFGGVLDTVRGFNNLVDVSSFPLGSLQGLQFLGGFGSLEVYHEDFIISDSYYLETIEAFSALHTIQGNFMIENNANLNEISNFVSLKTVEGTFRINDNFRLNTIADFNTLEEVLYDSPLAIGRAFEITNNNNLNKVTSFNALELLNGELEIDQNNKLDSIVGFNALTEVEFLSSSEFNNFKYLDGFNSLDTIIGNWIVSGDQIQVIKGFQNLKYIEGRLSIILCENLRELAPFNQLKTVDQFSLYSCPRIKDFEGLQSLEQVTIFNISSCDSLTSLNGLDNLEKSTSIGFQDLPRLIHLPDFSNLDTVLNIHLVYLDILDTLTAFANTKHVRSISIERNEQLVSFLGFDNLNSLSHFKIKENDRLKTLPAFPNLSGAMNSIEILENNSLEVFSGFNQLDEIINIEINYNDSLQSVTGFNALNLVEERLALNYNEALNDIDGFDNLNAINGRFDLIGHMNLSPCDFTFLCRHVSNGGFSWLGDNGPGCNSEDEILENCAPSIPVKIFTFLDGNTNGILDDTEPFLANIIYNYLPSNTQILSSQNNPINLFPIDGMHQINFSDENASWDLTTNFASYSVDVINGTTEDSLFFGLSAAQEVVEIQSLINSLPTRCNEQTTFEIHAQNLGTTYTNGTIWFEFDEEIDQYSFIDLPDIEEGTNKFGWQFSQLTPTGSLTKKINLFIPGPDLVDFGTQLNYRSYIDYTVGATDYISEDFTYSTIINCAYDPNDKLVSPTRSDHYSLPDEQLVYTIRFQNTGNAEATNVTVIDTLSTNLDPSTFKLLSSSHSDVLSVTIKEENIVHFDFIDIYLIDSFSNALASQGYVSFSIDGIPGLEELDQITNSAAIYFDQNPPIFTNQTLNIIAFDEDNDESFSPVDCDDNDANINPNMNEIPYNGNDDDCNSLTPDDDLDGDSFLLIDDCDDNDPNINPNAEEIVGNDIDENCDGNLVTITSIINNPLFSIRPNPASQYLEVLSADEIERTVEIYSSLGQLVHTQPNLSLINLSRLTDGVYFLRIKSQDNHILFTEKIVIVR